MPSFSYCRLLLVLLVSNLPSLSFAQQNDYLYYAQWSSVAGVISSEFGRGYPVAGDLNNDGLADFVAPVTDMLHVGIAKIKNGQLHFEMQRTEYYNPTELLYRAYLLDMNGDGLNDCYTLVEDAGECCPPLVFYNENSKLSDQPVEFKPTVAVNELKVPVHLNADPVVDTLFLNGASSETQLIDGRTGITYFLPWKMSIKPELFHDFNGDGLIDFMLDVNYSNSLDTAGTVILLNQGNFSFIDYQSEGKMFGDQYGDFDGDGISDIITTNGPGNFRIRTKLLSPSSAQTQTINFPDFPTPFSYFVHDLDGDAFSDILVFKSDTSFFYHNQQDGSFQKFAHPFRSHPGLFFTWDNSWGNGQLVAQDGTGRPLLYRANFDNGVYQIEDLTGMMDPPVLGSPGYGYASAIIDIDNDDKPELIVTQGDYFVYRELENDTFHSQPFLTDLGFLNESSTAHSLTSGDFNGDGLIDLVYSVVGSQSDLRVKFCQADSTFSAPQSLPGDFGVPSIISTDINKDGLDDIAVAGGLTVTWFEGQVNGQFIPHQVLTSSSDNFMFIDPNKDGLPDLAITVRDTTKIYLNQSGAYTFAQHIPGSLAKSSQVGTNQLILLFTQPEYQIAFIELDSIGTGHEVIWKHEMQRHINYRTAYQLNYLQNGLVDLCYNQFVSNYDIAYLVYGIPWPTFSQLVFSDRTIVGVVDVNQDGYEDILWQIGPQIVVEFLGEEMTTSSLDPPAMDLKIFPNPTQDFIRIQSAKLGPITSIELYHPNGILAGRYKEKTIDLRDLPSGIYLLRIIAESGKVVTKRIIKI